MTMLDRPAAGSRAEPSHAGPEAVRGGLDKQALALIFREARTANRFTDRPVEPPLLRRIYELMRMGPTSMNGSPGRIAFLTTAAAKARLEPALFNGNVEKTRTAPVTAIIGYDMEFYEYLPRLYPHAPEWRILLKQNETAAQIAALRNSSIQGGYLILAARAVGLDCGPMSGFDNAKVDHEFFAGTHVKSNFLCNLGYADPATTHPRGPRFAFEEVCQIV